ncbi:MAG TPA: hypothetical protein PKC43_04050 [Phycisphaerales bacterium]|nr:hypothetical protein [Phycisphaerales bacterium]HMP36599.1 hypothetical protein [Phycisphaerales bacterium]
MQITTHHHSRSGAHTFRLLLAGAAAALGSAAAPGQLKSWTAGHGSWSSAGHWSPIGLPGPGNQVFIGNLPAAENTSVTLDINTVIGTLAVTDGMRIITSGGQLAVLGTTTLSGYNVVGQFGHPSRLTIADGPAEIDAVLSSVALSDGAWLQLQGGALLAGGAMTVGPECAINGAGTLSLTANAPVALLLDGFLSPGAAGIVINQIGTGRVDLDGAVAGESSINVTASSYEGPQYAHLTINGTGLADPMDDMILLGRGNALRMNLSEGWTLGPGAAIKVFGGSGNPAPPASELTGGEFRLKGTLDLLSSSSLLHVHAPIICSPSADVLLAPGALCLLMDAATIDGASCSLGAGSSLRFNGPTVIGDGTFAVDAGPSAAVQFNGASVWNGTVGLAGRAVVNGPASVVGPTVIDGGRFDLDGFWGETEWSVVNSLVLNVESINSFNNTFAGAMSVGGNGFARLSVNLDDPAASWMVAPITAKLSLGGIGAIMVTRVDGSPLRMFGQLEISGAIRIASDTALEPGSLVVFATPTSRVRFAGSTHVAASTGFFGEGRLENQSTGTLTLAPGTNLALTDLLNSGTLRIGPANGAGPGIASADRAIFESSATWRIAIGGHAPGSEHDRLVLGGAQHSLAGALEVDLLDLGGGLFAPEVGDTFTVLVAPPTTLSGSFVEGPITTVPGGSYLWQIGSHTGEVADVVTLTVAEFHPCPADLNGDGAVDGADLGLLLSAWGGCASCPGDLSGDGILDGADLGILLSSWGACPMS